MSLSSVIPDIEHALELIPGHITAVDTLTGLVDRLEQVITELEHLFGYIDTTKVIDQAPGNATSAPSEPATDSTAPAPAPRLTVVDQSFVPADQQPAAADALPAPVAAPLPSAPDELHPTIPAA